MLKCFPPKSLKLFRQQIGSMGMGVIMWKDDSIWQYSRVFLLYGVSQFLKCVCIALCIDCGFLLWEVDKQRTPAVQEQGHNDLTGTYLHRFVFLREGRIEVSQLLALQFALRRKIVAICFVLYDKMWQKHILFLMVPLHMTQDSQPFCKSFVCQVMRILLCKHFL